MASKGKNPAGDDIVIDMFKKININDAEGVNTHDEAASNAKVNIEQLFGDKGETIEEMFGADAEVEVEVKLINPQVVGWESSAEVEKKITSPPQNTKNPFPLGANFKYKTLPPDHIRLLRIVALGDIPWVQMHDYPIGATPEYIAVSYAWGSGPNTRTFLCNNQPFGVTSHLLDGINSLGLGLESMLWIDAICINQKDNDEKAAQVAGMQRIYAQASSVVVWLGPAEHDSDIFFENFEDFMQWGIAYDEKVSSDQYGVFENPLLKTLFHALGHLLLRPWFGRVWVVQEVLLANDVTLVCGTRSLDWLWFCWLIVMVRTKKIDKFLVSPEVRKGPLAVATSNVLHLHMAVNNPADKADNKAGGQAINKARRGFSPGRFTLLLNTGRDRKVTEPVDRVWGYMGLAEPELRNAAIPFISYSEESKRDFYRTYVNVGRLLLSRDPDLTLLSIVPSATRPAGSPSWVPNFHAAGLDGVPMIGQLNFRFHAGLKAKETVKPEIKFGNDNQNILMLQGFRVDTVDKILKLELDQTRSWEDERLPTASQQNLTIWESQCLKLARSTSRSVLSSMPDTHVRTMLQDKMASQPFRAVRKNYSNWRKWINDFHPTGDAGFTGKELAAILDVHNDINVSVSRAYFSTKGGRIGLGPRNMASGDTVCIVYGAKVPYIIRFQPGDGSTCEFVGDAFVDGVMYGEALGKGTKSETFSIS